MNGMRIKFNPFHFHILQPAIMNWKNKQLPFYNYKFILLKIITNILFINLSHRRATNPIFRASMHFIHHSLFDFAIKLLSFSSHHKPQLQNIFDNFSACLDHILKACNHLSLYLYSIFDILFLIFVFSESYN